MRIRLLLFALYRDLTGTSELDLDVPEGTTAAALVRALRARGDGFARLPHEPVVAVNRAYTGLEAVLQEGDEVALLPPVAGG